MLVFFSRKLFFFIFGKNFLPIFTSRTGKKLILQQAFETHISVFFWSKISFLFLFLSFKKKNAWFCVERDRFLFLLFIEMTSYSWIWVPFEATWVEKKLRIIKTAAVEFFFLLSLFTCMKERKVQLPRCFLQHSIDLHFLWLRNEGRERKKCQDECDKSAEDYEVEDQLVTDVTKAVFEFWISLSCCDSSFRSHECERRWRGSEREREKISRHVASLIICLSILCFTANRKERTSLGTT